MLKEKAKKIRLKILEMANRSGGPHVGTCLSCADILTWLYFKELKIETGESNWDNRDYFILSKGHGAMALYSALGEKGIIDNSILEGYMQDGGTLPAHLDRFSAPGIEVSAGSLGHGLPIGLGLAHGFKLFNKPNRVFVLMGDGESQEGSIWESAMMAPKLGVDNLIAIIDNNDLQGYGRPSEISNLSPIKEKWEAFGWHAEEADGHDFESMVNAFDRVSETTQPSVIVCKTIKGKGVSFMEDELKWHYFIVSDEIFAKAEKEIKNA